MNALPRTPIGLRAPGRPGVAERIYRVLLRAYPPGFRAKYGREMALLFRDQCREAKVRTLSFWAAVIWDVARSAPGLRAEAWRAGANASSRTLEVIMRLTAMLTVLLGAFVTVSAMADGVAGFRGPMSGTYVLSVALAIFAGALLLTAGVALRRGAPSGRKTATLALLAFLAIIVAARLLHPWMSLFSQLVGIGLPVALLIALHWPRRPSASPAAFMIAHFGTLALLAFGVPAGASAQDTTQAGAAVKELPLTVAQRQSYMGSYTATLPQGGQVSVHVFGEKGVLKLWVSDTEEARRLLYQGDNVFLAENTPDFVVTFAMEGGRATGFSVRKEDGVIVAARNSCR